MIRFRFVDDMRKTYPVKRLCDVLKINRSSYYKWKKTAPTRNNRLISDAVLGAKIKSIFTKERGCYGAKRITAELNDEPDTTTQVNHKRVARVMSSMKLYGLHEDTQGHHHNPSRSKAGVSGLGEPSFQRTSR